MKVKDGTCIDVTTDEFLASLIASYVPTTVEGDDANAVRSHVRMDGTLDDYNNAGGTLKYIESLAASLEIDQS
jgi:hypothetical protein